MNEKNIKIPIIIIPKEKTTQGSIIFENITNLLLKNNIPFVTYIDSNFQLHFQKSKYRLESIEEVLKVSNVCVIIESGYNKEIESIVDLFLENGKDILCFPSNILSKQAIFSNNLIRDGAICITSEYMLLEYLLNLE
ncbi:MAG: hypothetical protein IJ809_01305 [Clostridia bacterium]|nr:hypothetical protein [Clostridia bacterium]